MIKVNLLGSAQSKDVPREWVPAAQKSAVMGLSLLLVTAVGVGGAWYYLHHQRTVLEGRIATGESELVRLKEAAKLVAVATARKTELTERLALIDRLRTTKRGPVSLLETVNNSIPEGLWLLEVKQGGMFVQVDGRAMSLSSVTDFAERMQNSGLFKMPVEILTTSTETVDERELVRFSVKAEAVPPPSSTTPSTATKTATTTASAGAPSHTPGM